MCLFEGRCTFSQQWEEIQTVFKRKISHDSILLKDELFNGEKTSPRVLRTWSDLKKVGSLFCPATDLHDLHYNSIFAMCIGNLSVYKPHSRKCNSSIEVKNTPCWLPLCRFDYLISICKNCDFQRIIGGFAPGQEEKDTFIRKDNWVQSTKEKVCASIYIIQV